MNDAETTEQLRSAAEGARREGGAFPCRLEGLVEVLLAAPEEPDEDAPRQPRRREIERVVHLDLRRNDEITRRLLYALVVKDYFAPREIGDPGAVCVPLVTPEEAELEVYWSHGRWFATWINLEEDPGKPEAERREFLLLEQEPPAEGPLHYREI